MQGCRIKPKFPGLENGKVSNYDKGDKKYNDCMINGQKPKVPKPLVVGEHD
ncbi:hypothetical protein GCM10007390_41090 [Persicitalea jodogahamensis]|uniref:Uncharacterized protein n=1 Tax=Persicitalea jodogahamensis TaxID=402147 RepID=A0A8J3DE13_9BACT|nr:hypothetical protein GCM10007390_41090 [Persicitalea jodogahamensis]